MIIKSQAFAYIDTELINSEKITFKSVEQSLKLKGIQARIYLEEAKKEGSEWPLWYYCIEADNIESCNIALYIFNLFQFRQDNYNPEYYNACIPSTTIDSEGKVRFDEDLFYQLHNIIEEYRKIAKENNIPHWSQVKESHFINENDLNVFKW